MIADEAIHLGPDGPDHGGRAARGTLNEGRVYLPGGFIDTRRDTDLDGDGDFDLIVHQKSVGAIAEAKILGGQSVIPITHDIEIAFTYAQNWPLGAALAVLLMLVIGGLTLVTLHHLDLERILGRR